MLMLNGYFWETRAVFYWSAADRVTELVWERQSDVCNTAGLQYAEIITPSALINVISLSVAPPSVRQHPAAPLNSPAQTGISVPVLAWTNLARMLSVKPRTGFVQTLEKSWNSKVVILEMLISGTSIAN